MRYQGALLFAGTAVCAVQFRPPDTLAFLYTFLAALIFQFAVFFASLRDAHIRVAYFFLILFVFRTLSAIADEEVVSIRNAEYGFKAFSACIATIHLVWHNLKCTYFCASYQYGPGSFCWLALVDRSRMVYDPRYQEYLFGGLRFGSTISREQYHLITALNPSRDYLAGRLAIKNGTIYFVAKFDRRTHRRLSFGPVAIDNSLYIHVDARKVVDTAANANAATMGLSAANEEFKAVLGSMFKLPFNMSTRHQEALKKMVPFPFSFSGGKTNTSDHQVLAGARVLLRDAFERMYRITDTKIPTLVVGSTANDLDTYELSPNVDFFFHLSEGKDYGRTVTDMLTKFSKRLSRNFGRSKNDFNSTNGRFRKVFHAISEILENYKIQGQLPNTFVTDKSKVEKRYERIVLRDIYEMDAAQAEDWFLRTGANQMVGYGIYPDELLFDKVAPDQHYKWNYNPVTDVAAMTYSKGYSNGYAHKKSVWSWWLRNPVTVCAHFNMVAEVTCRIGPYAIYTITRTTSTSEYVPRTISLPDHKWRALVLDVAAAHKAGKITDDMRYAVNINEWAATVNWALSLNPSSLTYNAIVLYVRRMATGVSLVNRELTEAWQIKPIDIPRFALSVLVHCTRQRELSDAAFEGAVAPATVNFARSLYRKPVSLLDGLISFVTRNGFSEEIAVFPDNEWTSVDQTPFIRDGPSDSTYIVDITSEHSTKVDCAFCEKMEGRLGAQIMHCHNPAASGVVDVSMTDDEILAIMTGLIDDDNDPAQLALLKQEVKKLVPSKGWSKTARFSYILGGPGTGKSYIIKGIATDEDAVYAPFCKLSKDYKQVPDPGTGKVRDLRFATTHRGLKLGLVKTLYIDEFTALDWNYIRLVIALSAPDEVIIVGDMKQTGIRTGTVEGTHIGDAVDIAALPRHELMFNFRNGWDTVHWLNKVGDYGCGTHKVSSEDFDPSASSIQVVPDPASAYKHEDGFEQLFFTHAVALAHGFTQDVDKYTVRSYQGSTVGSVELKLTEGDLLVADAHGMMIVALSRAKVLTRIIHDDAPATRAFLDRWHLPREGKYVADVSEMPVPVSNQVAQHEAPNTEAWWFCQNISRDHSFEVDHTKRWYVNSYMALSAIVAVVSLRYPIAANLMIAAAASGFTWSWSGLYVLAPAASKFFTIAWSLRMLTTFLFVFFPNLVGPWLSAPGDDFIFRTVFGEVFGHGLAVAIDKSLNWVVATMLRFLILLPPFWRFLYLGFVEVTNAPLVPVLLRTPSPLDLADSRVVTLGFIAYVLYIYRGSRSVFCLELRPENSYKTFVSGFSFWTTTVTVSLGGRLLTTPSTLWKAYKDTSADMALAYSLMSGRYYNDPVRTFFGTSNDDADVDLEFGIAGYIEGSRGSGQDAFNLAQEMVVPSMIDDPAIPINLAESVAVPGNATNGSVNPEDANVPLNARGHVEEAKTEYVFTSGYGYTFSKTNVWQSIAAVVSRYANPKPPVKPVGAEAQLLVNEITNLAIKELFNAEKLGYDDELMEQAISESIEAARKKGYENQVKDVDSVDAHTVRMVMKATFKAGPFSNLKPFDPSKPGMGVSPFDKHAHVVFAAGMRYLNMMVLKTLKSHVIYDNRLTEDQMQAALNEALREVPTAGAVNGVTDFKQYDSQQDAFTQALFKEMMMRLGSSEEFIDHYLSFCSGGKVLAAGSMKIRLGFEKLSGDPATLLSNTLIGLVLLNFVFRGDGPVAIAVKGDDGFKRQCNLKVCKVNLNRLERHTRLNIMMSIDDPAEFIGKIVSTQMVDHIPRKLTQIISKRYKSWQHFAETQNALRDWVDRIERLPINQRVDVFAVNALLVLDNAPPGDPQKDAQALNSVETMYDAIKSFSHISKEQFLEQTHHVLLPRVIPASGFNPGVPVPTL